jgi:hypothetical protein
MESMFGSMRRPFPWSSRVKENGLILEKTVDKIIGFQAKESTPTLGI